MLRNYLKIAIRNIKRHKLYALISILGLAFGIACSILLFLYVQDELTSDKHHANKERIYRMNNRFLGAGRVQETTTTGWLLKGVLEKDYPEIER